MAEITVVESDGTAQLCLKGHVTAQSAGELHQAALRVADRPVVVRCGEVERLDAAALQVLLALRNEARRHGRPFAVEGMPREVAALVRLAGLPGDVSGT